MRTHKQCFFLLTTTAAVLLLFSLQVLADTASDYQQGNELFSAGRYAEAAVLFDKVVSAGGELMMKAELQLAQCYGRQGLRAQGIAVLRRSLGRAEAANSRKDRKNLEYTLARYLLMDSNWTDAQVEIQKLLVDDPVEGGRLLSEYYRGRKEYDQAIQVRRDLISRYDRCKGLYDTLLMAELLFEAGRQSELKIYLADLREWVKTNIEEGDPLERAEVGRQTIFMCQEPEIARDFFNYLLEHDQKVDAPHIKFNMVYCDYTQRNYASARSGFQNVYETCGVRTYEGNSLYMVGDCNVHLRDFAKAKEAFQGLISRYPEHALVSRAAERLAALESAKSTAGNAKP